MVDFRLRCELGVLSEFRNIVRQKSEVEVLPFCGLVTRIGLFSFFMGDATQVVIFFSRANYMRPLSPGK